MTWNHSICDFCWEVRCIAEGQPGRIPVRITVPDWEQCCFCGQETMAGIYVRHDQRELTCPHAREA